MISLCEINKAKDYTFTLLAKAIGEGAWLPFQKNILNRFPRDISQHPTMISQKFDKKILIFNISKQAGTLGRIQKAKKLKNTDIFITPCQSVTFSSTIPHLEKK